MSATTTAARIDVLLSRLDGVRAYGQGWRAPCPACGGRNRDKLSLRLADDGKILLKCFAGCEPADIMQACGLSLQDLFPERLDHGTPEDRRRAQRAFRESAWGGALDVIAFESLIVQIAADQLFTTEQPLSWDDQCRLALATKRIGEALAILRPRNPWKPDVQ